MSDRAAIRTSIIRNLPSFLADYGCRVEAVLDRRAIKEEIGVDDGREMPDFAGIKWILDSVD